MRKFVIMTDGDDGWAIYLTKDGSFDPNRKKAKRFFTERGARKYLASQDGYVQMIGSVYKL